MVWREWIHQAIANHTWPNWKLHWTTVSAKMSNINRVMAGEAALGGFLNGTIWYPVPWMYPKNYLMKNDF